MMVIFQVIVQLAIEEEELVIGLWNLQSLEKFNIAVNLMHYLLEWNMH